jgi:glutamate carboxypeptidase
MYKYITEYLDEKSQEMTILLNSLVNIDSSSYDSAGVTRVLQTLCINLKEMGFMVDIIKNLTNPPSLIAKKAGIGAKRILLIGHADTVFERGTALDRPFKIEGERMYGPGIADMKAGLVTIIYSLKALQNINFTDYKEIVVIIGGDEEIGSPSSQKIYEKETEGTDYCLVFEPGRSDRYIISSRKGVGEFYLKIFGVSSHSGDAPENGVSAIKELAHKIVALESLNDYKRGVTVNVGVIKGGTRPNIIPDFAEAYIDVRIPDMETGKEIETKIKEIASYNNNNRVRVELAGGINRGPMVKSKKTEEMLEIIKRAGQLLNIEIKHRGTGGASDGNFVSAKGVPVVDGMGPDGGDYHSPQEYIYKESLVSKTKLTALTIIELCNN